MCIVPSESAVLFVAGHISLTILPHLGFHIDPCDDDEVQQWYACGAHLQGGVLLATEHCFLVRPGNFFSWLAVLNLQLDNRKGQWSVMVSDDYLRSLT